MYKSFVGHWKLKDSAPHLKCRTARNKLILKKIFPPVGESQQISAVGSSDIPEDSGEDPGESNEQSGNLDRLAVPA